MPLEMKNNTTSINALNNLEKAQNELSDSLRRLSSGQKINIAADAPVGLIISEGLRAQIASVHQALQDTEFSLSLVQTAEGALAPELHSIPAPLLESGMAVFIIFSTNFF